MKTLGEGKIFAKFRKNPISEGEWGNEKNKLGVGGGATKIDFGLGETKKKNGLGRVPKIDLG